MNTPATTLRTGYGILAAEPETRAWFAALGKQHVAGMYGIEAAAQQYAVLFERLAGGGKPAEIEPGA